MEQHYNSMNRVETNDSKAKTTQKKYLSDLNKTRTDALKSSQSLESEVSALGDIIKKNYLQERTNNTLYSKQLIEINNQIGEGFTSYFNNVVDHETRMFALNREVLHPSTGGGYLRESYEKMYSSTKDEFIELFSYTNSENAIIREESNAKLMEMGISKKDIKELSNGYTGNQHDVNKLIQTLEERGHVRDEASKREMKFQKDNADQMKTLMNGIGERQEKFSNSMEESGKKLFGGNEIGGVLGKTIGKNLSQINPFRMTEDNNGIFGKYGKKANQYLTNKAGGALSGVHAGGENLNKGITSLFTSKFAKKITSKGLQDRLEAGAFRENEKQDRIKHDRKSTRQSISEAFTGKSDTLNDTLYNSNTERKIQEEQDLVFSRMTEEQRKKAKRISSVVPRDLLNSDRETFDDSEQRTSDQAGKMSDLDKVVTGPGLTPNSPSINSGMGRMGGLPNESKLSFSSFINSNTNSPMMSSTKTSSGKHTDSNPNSPLMSFVQTSGNQDPTLIDGKLMNENNKQQSIYYTNKNSNRKEDFGTEDKEPKKKSLKDKVSEKLNSGKESVSKSGTFIKEMLGKLGTGAGSILGSLSNGAGGLVKGAGGLVKGAGGLIAKGAGGMASLISGAMPAVMSALTAAAPALLAALAIAGIAAIAYTGFKAFQATAEADALADKTNEKTNSIVDKAVGSISQQEATKLKELREKADVSAKKIYAVSTQFSEAYVPWANSEAENKKEAETARKELVKYENVLMDKNKDKLSSIKDGEGLASLNNTKDIDKDQIKTDNKKKIDLSTKTADNTEKMVKNLENLNKNLFDIVNSSKQAEYMSDNVKGK